MAQRPDCLHIAYEILKPRFGALSFLEFENHVKDFEVIPVELNGELVGAIMKNGTELHALVLEKARGKWFGKKALKVIQDTIKQHGYATTRVKDDHLMGHEFALRLGFEVDKSKNENGITHYIKVKPCQE